MGKVPDDLVVYCNCSSPPLPMALKKEFFGDKTYICTACLKTKTASMFFGELSIKEN